MHVVLNIAGKILSDRDTCNTDVGRTLRIEVTRFARMTHDDLANLLY